VSTFYLLPPRPLLGDRVADFLLTVLPGLAWDSSMRANLAEAIAAAAAAHENVHVVFRDDLPADESAAAALVDGFGADAGDEVVEVRPTGASGGLTSRRWRVGPRGAA
jgi:hypothetical protein